MSNIAFKKRITLNAFDAKLQEDFGYVNLSRSRYAENGLDDNDNPVVKKMWLYYYDGIHIGTWMQGEGWIFKSAYLIDGAPGMK